MTSMTHTAEDSAEAVLDRVSDAFFALDDGWRFTYLNDRAGELLERSPDELVGTYIWDEFSEAIDSPFYESYHRAMETQTPVTFEAHYEPLDTDFEVRAYPSESGISVYFNDITERLAAQEALQQTNHQLIIISRLLRHDIRNDMMIVLGWAEELRQYIDDDDGMLMLERILRTADHTVNLTNIARDFIGVLEDQRAPELVPVDLRSVFLDDLDRRRAAHGDEVFRIDGEVPELSVWASSLLSSVFRNILNNAVEHNDATEPRVDISFETDTETVSVRIADNGPGVPDHLRDAIFARGSSGLDDPAAGIGLFLVNTLVTEYDGAVWVEDNDPRGACFVVELRRVHDGERADRVVADE